MCSPNGPNHLSTGGTRRGQDVGPYALGHGLGLTLHDRPFFNQQAKQAGVPRQVFQAGMVLAVETYPAAEAEKTASASRRTFL